MDKIYRADELFVKRLTARTEDEEVFKMMEGYTKYILLAFSGGWLNTTLENGNSPSQKYFPVTKSRLEILQAENQAMKSTICALNAYLSE